MEIHGYAAWSPGKKLTPFVYRKKITSTDVLVRVKFTTCTLSDIRFIDDFWGDSRYPFIPGEETIGVVQKIGNKVRGVKAGDWVGIGWQVGACFRCKWCRTGSEQFCQEKRLARVNEYGGFADYMIVDYRFVFKLPPNLRNSESTPLMCAGLTVWSAIKKNRVKAGMKVGVIGLGRLGHLALQFLDKMGCEVTAFSHSPNKKSALLKLGADFFISSDEPKTLARLGKKYDFLIFTSAASADWNLFIKALKPTGGLCFVGFPPEPISFKIGLLNDYAQKTVMGSYIGSRREMREVLQFSLKNNVRSLVEIFPMNQVNKVIEKVRVFKIPFAAALANR